MSSDSTPSTDKLNADGHIPTSTVQELDFGKCSASSECAGNRICLNLGINDYEERTRKNTYQCVSTGRDCLSHADCDNEEPYYEADADTSTCASNAIAIVEDVPTADVPRLDLPSTGDITNSVKAVCISAHHLSGLSLDEMLYAEHKLERALCERYESSATAGHIARYKCWIMTMSSYCKRVECEEKIHHVNGVTQQLS